ncbi:hypothetical protein LDENG_00194750 [Lucifuga dentata]|nr:hypothetical protein LDENG_00194750 [Lucifuga dentata]
MAEKKELSQKLREEIISLHQNGNGYKKISNILKVPRQTVGNVIQKFKTHDTAANLPGHGRKSKILPRGVRGLQKTAEKTHTTAIDLHDDMMKAGTKLSV